MTPDEQETEPVLASRRAKVEHVLFWIKRESGYSKTRYRRLAKNSNRLYMLAALTNLMIARRFLSPAQGIAPERRKSGKTGTQK